ncbi:MAG: hypothetical protein PUH24_04670 [Prevotellaceae bacterium]|nr:hypothetical protein [Prevotellaceae bacterium]MDY6130665.1 hypothetical protein [Prevotella sp.]
MKPKVVSSFLYRMMLHQQGLMVALRASVSPCRYHTMFLFIPI